MCGFGCPLAEMGFSKACAGAYGASNSTVPYYLYVVVIAFISHCLYCKLFFKGGGVLTP